MVKLRRLLWVVIFFLGISVFYYWETVPAKPSAPANPVASLPRPELSLLIRRHFVLVQSGKAEGESMEVMVCGVTIDSKKVVTVSHVLTEQTKIIIVADKDLKAPCRAKAKYVDRERDLLLLETQNEVGERAQIRGYEVLEGEELAWIGNASRFVGWIRFGCAALPSSLIFERKLIPWNYIVLSPGREGDSGGGVFDMNGNLVSVISKKIKDEIGGGMPAVLAIKNSEFRRFLELAGEY